MNATARGLKPQPELKDLFAMMKHVHVKVVPADEDAKQAAAANTARLRELRLAKEAADRETGSGQAISPVRKSRAPRDGKQALRAS